MRINYSSAKIINVSEIFMLKLHKGTERKWRLILTEQSREDFLEVWAFESGFEERVEF